MRKRNILYKIVTLYPKFILSLTLITLQMIVTTLGVNTWPLSSYDMFTQMPPKPMLQYVIEHKTKSHGVQKYIDFNKVSFEIYKNFNNSHNYKILETYTKLQTKSYEQKMSQDVISTKILKKDSMNKESDTVIYELNSNENI